MACIMIDAQEQKCEKVISNLFGFFPWKNCLVWLSFFISFIILLLLLYNNSLSFECIHIIEDKLFNVNLSVMGIDLAALAILFALFQDKKLSSEAKKAFKEQSGAFLFNAMAQLMAMVTYVICTIISIQTLFYVTFLIQIWAMLLVFDVLVELSTLISAIINQ